MVLLDLTWAKHQRFSMTQTFKIAIVGAGPAGCMLARLLHIQGIETIIFEGDSSINFRSQGATLDLHTTSGLAAIKAAKLYDRFLELARFDGEALVVCDRRLRKYINLSGASADKGSRGAPEIDRYALRKLLAESLPEGTIRWNHRVRKVNEQHRLHFDHGIEEGFDLVVGADGAWSKVRQLVSDQMPIYSGIAGTSSYICNAKETAPDIYKLVNRGSVFAYDSNSTITGQQVGDGSVYVSEWSPKPENWQETSDYDVKNSDAFKKHVAEEYKDWAPILQSFLQEANEDVTPRSLYMLPTGFKWEHKRGVTCIGDAAHVMVPFAGEGVNVAFADTLDLSAVIVKASKTGDTGVLDRAVAAFERTMFKRARRAGECSEGMMNDMFFTEGAPRTSIESWMSRKLRYEFGPVIYYLTLPLLYVGFFFYKMFL